LRRRERSLRRPHVSAAALRQPQQRLTTGARTENSVKSPVKWAESGETQAGILAFAEAMPTSSRQFGTRRGGRMRMQSISKCWLSSLLALALCLSCAGDDSSDDGAMCSGDGPCGGKLEGSWKLAVACYIIIEQPKLPSCPEATAELHATLSDGNITFEKDSYERHLNIETQMKLNIPAKCKDADKRECDSYKDLSTRTMLSCKDAAQGCECTADFAPTLTNDSGGYTIRGNKVDLTGDSFDYCVKNNKLTLQPTKPIAMSGTPVTSQLQTSFEKN
jgi:hypothetical protein